MALPVRVEHRHHQSSDPFAMARQNFADMLGRFMGGGLFGEPLEAGPLGAMGNYGVDIREDAEHIFVAADLPGFRKEDVDVSLENGVLTIAAERREEETVGPQPGEQPKQGQAQQKKQHEADYLLRERRMERFVRSFSMPADLDEQSVQAKLENGVLKITMNKREQAKAKRIPVS